MYFPANVKTERFGPLQTTQTFICQGGVNTVRLLGLTRKTLIDAASGWRLNALTDEEWICEIFRRKGDVYEVRVRVLSSPDSVYIDGVVDPRLL